MRMNVHTIQNLFILQYLSIVFSTSALTKLTKYSTKYNKIYEIKTRVQSIKLLGKKESNVILRAGLSLPLPLPLPLEPQTLMLALLLCSTLCQGSHQIYDPAIQASPGPPRFLLHPSAKLLRIKLYTKITSTQTLSHFATRHLFYIL